MKYLTVNRKEVIFYCWAINLSTRKILNELEFGNEDKKRLVRHLQKTNNEFLLDKNNLLSLITPGLHYFARKQCGYKKDWRPPEFNKALYYLFHTDQYAEINRQYKKKLKEVPPEKICFEVE